LWCVEVPDVDVPVVEVSMLDVPPVDVPAWAVCDELDEEADGAVEVPELEAGGDVD
jgi:hypothetical protein